ncbi:MAG: flagellar basal body P-ring formation chaperone FlgA [Phaeovulum sp.]|uniref:flagellar basal body P-ring formation chaperone FlgA n=1 Tax=Phaeovulum sp. TaxID=2934796 RepID=UPI002733B851|nr:flagellar basal body P-ring formation chaperone FlgA [Phaeovulum sp.]MDP3862211.1 flagellar basal body P-ring formation chaperone FlgA [Phaeovulum sp.]
MMLGREFWVLTAVFLALAASGRADVVVAARTLRAQAVIGPEDVSLTEGTVPGALISLSEAIGQEARNAIYAGRVIRIDDVGPPAVIERNQIVPLLYRRGALSIQAEGRALGRGGVGDSLRAINITSRTTVTGLVAPDGTLVVFSNE